MPIVECKNCGKEEMKPRKRDFCSKGCATSYRQKAHDPNFFDVSDELGAYMLGLILTDGCISQQPGKLKRLTLVNTDIELLEKLQKVVCPNRKIYEQRRLKEHHSQAYALVSTNEEVIEKLRVHGIHEQKTFDVKCPELREELVRHFIRGVFDGDGSIYSNVNPKYGVYKHISITTASESFADGLIKTLEAFGFNPKMTRDSRGDHKAIYIKLYRKEEVKKFHDWIYEESNWHMIRKEQAFSDDIV